MSKQSIQEARWQRLQSVFEGALSQEPSDRPTWVAKTCHEDPALRAEVLRLLAYESAAPAFLAPPGEGLLAAGMASGGVDPWTNRRIGNYRLIRQLAVGGMGIVWLAERADAAYEQRVAIKIMHGWMLSEEQARRFHRERQTLASLEHPAITKILDGGTTTEGLPFLVMELVQGMPIDEYCDKAELGTQQRIALFRLVCDAVSYAHRSLVVHRDLKPINILINKGGGPKLVDFGVAEVLLGEGTNSATVSSSGFVTPRYASPEQIAGRTASVMSDVYSLGVILYELLTGRSLNPAVDGTDGDARTAQVKDRIPASHAATASTTDAPPARKDRGTAEAIARDRGTTPRRLSRALRGDLDQIILKATREAPEERYSSVDYLLDDLDRHEHDLPIRARTPSHGYTLQKLFKRNKAVCLFGSVFVVGLLLSLAFALSSLRVAAHERSVAQSVTNVLEHLITTSNPYFAPDDPVKMLTLINAQVDGAFPDEPAAEARVRIAIGRTLAELWQFSAAREQFQEAVDLARIAGKGARSLEIDALTRLTGALAHFRDRTATVIAEQALAALSTQPDANPCQLARIKSVYSFALWNATDVPDMARAEALGREAIQTFRETPECKPRDLAVALHRFAGLLWEKGLRTPEIGGMHREALIYYRQSPQGTDRSYAECLRAISYSHSVAGEVRAEAKVLREFVRLTPTRFYDALASRGVLWRLGAIETALGRFDVARDLLRRALRSQCLYIHRRGDPKDKSWHELSQELAEPTNDAMLGEYGGLIAEKTKSEAAFAHQWLMWKMLLVVRFLAEDDAAVVAEKLLANCVENQGDVLANNAIWQTCVTQLDGMLALSNGRLETARRTLTASYGRFARRIGRRHALTVHAAELVAQLYDRLDQPNKAEHYRALMVPYAQSREANGTLIVGIIRGLLDEADQEPD